MAEVYVLIAHENEKVKECIILPNTEEDEPIELGIKKALQEIYGNVTVTSRTIGDIPSNIARYMAGNSGKSKSSWIPFSHSWAAPAVNGRYLVKLSNGWVLIASYLHKKDHGFGESCRQFKNDSGAWIEDGSVCAWKELE